jgi:hypothetical protein
LNIPDEGYSKTKFGIYVFIIRFANGELKLLNENKAGYLYVGTDGRTWLQLNATYT